MLTLLHSFIRCHCLPQYFFFYEIAQYFLNRWLHASGFFFKQLCLDKGFFPWDYEGHEAKKDISASKYILLSPQSQRIVDIKRCRFDPKDIKIHVFLWAKLTANQTNEKLQISCLISVVNQKTKNLQHSQSSSHSHNCSSEMYSIFMRDFRARSMYNILKVVIWSTLNVTIFHSTVL